MPIRTQLLKSGWVWSLDPEKHIGSTLLATGKARPATGQNVKLFTGGGPEPATVRHVGDTDEHVGDVVTTSQVENELCCGKVDSLEALDVSERQVDQKTVAVVQPADDECRNKGIEDGRRYAATNASQPTQSGKAAKRAVCCTWACRERQMSKR